MFEIILILNAIWFALGFHAFAIRSIIFAKTIVPKQHRDTPVFDMLAASGKFVGGLNFALCILNVLILMNPGSFPESNQRLILCIGFALAHGSQFLPNVFIALDNRKGKGVWQVKGRMLFIFVTDFILMIGNFVVAGWYA